MKKDNLLRHLFKARIKFNGHHLFSGDWIEGSLIIKTSGVFIYVIDKDEFGNVIRELEIEVHPDTVCQFTGLLDKNGNKIFEGDTVRWGMNGYEMRVRHAVVEFNPDIQFRITHYINYSGEKEDTDNHVFRFGNFIYKKTENHLEITGNIHDETH